MGKFSNIFYGRNGGFFRFAAFATGIFLLVMLMKPGTNIIRWVHSAVEISRQEEQLRRYDEEIRNMENRIRMLASDRDTLETFAREQFYFAEPGDDVFILDD